MKNCEKGINDVIDDIWYDICVDGFDIEDVVEKYSKEYHFSEIEQNHMITILKKRQEEYDEEFED